jgi:hypothetical protein
MSILMPSDITVYSPFAEYILHCSLINLHEIMDKKWIR